MVSREFMLIAAGSMALASVGCGLMLLRASARSDLVTRRLRGVSARDEVQLSTGDAMTNVVAALGNALARSGVLSTGTIAQLEATLDSAGIGGGRGLALFIGTKMLLALTLLVLSVIIASHLSLTPMMHYLLPALATIAGLLAPDYLVKHRRQRYLDGVERGLPDALDLMVICSEAGLGLEPAIERVGQELVGVHQAMARELGATAHELQLVSDRRQALRNMGERTGLESLRRLAATLIQTTQLGTPLTQALRTLAAEMRQENMTRYEGRAAKLPVLLTFPMILFILPCVFIVVGGPAVLHASALLGKH